MLGSDQSLMRRTRRASLPQEITAQLMELISSERLPGNRLPPERTLCVQLGVSRGPLREALAALHQLGVIETHGKAKIGRPALARTQLALASASGSERALISDPLEARRMLEPEVAAAAAERASDDALAYIRECVERLEAETDPDAAARAIVHDSAFHLAVAAATRNSVLISLMQALSGASSESRIASWRVDGGQESSIRHHRAIYAAIAAHDADAARSAMRAHLEEVERLIRAMPERTGSSAG